MDSGLGESDDRELLWPQERDKILGLRRGARRATKQAPESATAGGGRWSAKRNMSLILELLRGAGLEGTSRKYQVTVATLSEWRRRRFLASGEAGLKRP
jgi:hypothetical protein